MGEFGRDGVRGQGNWDKKEEKEREKKDQFEHYKRICVVQISSMMDIQILLSAVKLKNIGTTCLFTFQSFIEGKVVLPLIQR